MTSMATKYLRAEAVVDAMDAYHAARAKLEEVAQVGELYPQIEWLRKDVTRTRTELTQLLFELQN